MASSPPLPPPAAGYAPEPAQDLSSPRVRLRLSPAAIEGFVRIAELWRLPDADARELLGGLSPAGWQALRQPSAGRVLTEDQLTRISLLIGIFKALNILFSEPLADSWMTLPNTNPLFGGIAPVQYAIEHGRPGLAEVRRLLDSRRGGQ